MTKKQKQAESILNHGLALQRIYPQSREYGPVTLCKKLHRLEARAHKIAEDICNHPIDMDKADKQLEAIKERANQILGSGPHVFINRDPRGYALKIEPQDARYLRIHKDWGGYGIIAPEF